MKKLPSIALAACLGLTGCQVFHTSRIWSKVVHSDIEASETGDVSKSYAEALHRELAAGGIEHKVVTYQYHYRSRLREDATAQRSAVIYRDDSNPTYPWWLMDESHGRPTWLPNGEVAAQLRFYIHRDAEIVDTKATPANTGRRIITRHHKHSVHTGRALPRVTEEAPDLDPNATFFSVHGANFDSDSAADREKMNALLRARNSTAGLRSR